MRWEQRACDECGRTSGPVVLVRDPNHVGPTGVLTMEHRGWGLVDNHDLCPDCMWMLEQPGQLRLVDPREAA